ncbi:hypothetical protein SI65_08775 [Aspergillus cristatus]|uniref:Nitrogen regulatory protein areA GATA-like domain-containing protein n=1 Tax=Aspergillus cristatus TaxID=573508 RepID=A0A1E3B4U4_ASPCR|nr:hypothetical protein SI65_08775 [Aspergillus cristatus]
MSQQQQQSDELVSSTPTEPSIDGQRCALQTPAADDTSLEEEPSRHVDYLSHDWREEDIWTSWRYMTRRKDVYSNGLRLENASWRTWAKVKFGLGTISPETLNWLKDCDVTWLYGPLKTSKNFGSDASPPPTHLTTPNMCQPRKPILKKKTASETMLQRSLSQHTLLQRAGALLKAKEAANAQDQSIPRSRHHEDQTGSTTPTAIAGTPTTASVSDIGSPNERRHIHFNNEVVQCIAIEAKDEEEEYGKYPTGLDDSLFSGNVAMTNQMLSNTVSGNMSSPRNNENKTIAPLPSTTLRGETPEPPASSLFERWFGSRSSPSPSPTPPKDSRRSSEPSANFLLDDDDDYDEYESNGGFDFSWQSNWQSKQVSSASTQIRPHSVNSEDDEDGLEMDRDFQLTYSDMFSLGEYSESPNAGIFDRVLDTVNTAKDIAHVIWNVGWRR